MKQNNKETGNIGENIAARYLYLHGYTVLERNYRKKWGEIDVIAQKDDCVHFVEVKTVAHETKQKLIDVVSHETWQPEDRVDRRKLTQINKALQTWISERSYGGAYQIDVLAVQIVPCETYATVKLLENVVVE